VGLPAALSPGPLAGRTRVPAARAGRGTKRCSRRPSPSPRPERGSARSPNPTPPGLCPALPPRRARPTAAPTRPAATRERPPTHPPTHPPARPPARPPAHPPTRERRLAQLLAPPPLAVGVVVAHLLDDGGAGRQRVPHAAVLALRKDGALLPRDRVGQARGAAACAGGAGVGERGPSARRGEASHAHGQRAARGASPAGLPAAAPGLAASLPTSCRNLEPPKRLTALVAREHDQLGAPPPVHRRQRDAHRLGRLRGERAGARRGAVRGEPGEGARLGSCLARYARARSNPHCRRLVDAVHPATHTHARTHTHAHAHTRTHARTHTRTHARTHAHTHTHTHTHTDTHTHTHTHTTRPHLVVLDVGLAAVRHRLDVEACGGGSKLSGGLGRGVRAARSPPQRTRHRGGVQAQAGRSLRRNAHPREAPRAPALRRTPRAAARRTPGAARA
jgi:hypothetical protein